jgi:Uma2 family endonuclease
MAIGETRATLEDLYREPGKAELIGGRIASIMPPGRKPNRIAGRIYRSLAEYADSLGQGEAFTDNMGFTIPELPSGRESFSPDAAYYLGPMPAEPMRFIEGPPTLAVEVRSENDYGQAAEAESADKRGDYFTAGTKVVWDVDPLSEAIHVYAADNRTQPRTYRRGQQAEAEPAVPGWKVAVDWIFS